METKRLLAAETSLLHSKKQKKWECNSKAIWIGIVLLLLLITLIIVVILWRLDLFSSSSKQFESFDPSTATINDVLDGITRENNAVTCLSIINNYMNRIKQYDKQNNINSIILLNSNATKEAIVLDEYYEKNKTLFGRLHCIPLLVKDNIDIKDIITSGGIEIFNKEWMISIKDADIIEILRKEGAIWIGKTNLASYSRSAYVTISELFGATNNPYSSQNRTVFGSSGGTAAAITAGFGIIGLGTDTLGSITLPSTGANIFGVRPPRSLMPMNGIQPLGNNTDTVGPMTRTIQDVVLGTNFSTYNAYNNESNNIGYITDLWQQQVFLNTDLAFNVSDKVFENQNNVLKLLNGINITLNSTEKNNLLSLLQSGNCLDFGCQAFVGSFNQYFLFHGNYTDSNRLISGPIPNGTISRQFIQRLNDSIGVPCPHCDSLRTLMRNFIDKLLNDYNIDVLLFPGTPIIPEKYSEISRDEYPTLGITPFFYSILDYPAIAIPVYFTPSIPNDSPLGLPNSMIAITRTQQFDTLFAFAYQYETLHQRQPPQL